MAEKERPGLPEDSGSFSYCYDALNRLTTVAQNGQTLRTYSYDAFGNRSSKTEYQTAGELTIITPEISCCRKQMQTERKIMRMTTEEICYP